MSRSGYSTDLDDQALNLWRGTVHRAIHGKRGQAMLRELLAALDAMLAEAVSHLSGLGVVCLDRADVLDAQGHADLLAWLRSYGHGVSTRLNGVLRMARDALQQPKDPPA